MRIKGIIAYFDGIDLAEGHYPGKILKQTEFGEYSPTPLGPLEACIKELHREGAIPQSGMFFDAGSGDGRVAVLMGEMGYDAYGMEGDEELARKGYQNGNILRELEVLRTDRPVIFGHGDFGDTKAYRMQLGIHVEEVGLFFNYQSNGDNLAKVIAAESPVGTKYLYLSNCPWAQYFAGAPELTLRKTKRLNIGRDYKSMYLRLFEKKACQQTPTHSQRHAHAPRAVV